MDKKRVAIVTGSSTGIGYETSLFLARRGFKTFATMRNLKKSNTIKRVIDDEKLPIHILQLDVDDNLSIKNAIKEILNEESHIDVLVNNAGYDLAGSLEEMSIDEFKAQFETNFFGVIRITKQILPIMRKQKTGTIINVSSVGGKIGIPLNSAYISSKFALEGLSDSIRLELKEFGIRVILIEPGVVRSKFFDNVKLTEHTLPNSPYAELTQKVFSSLTSLINTSSTPKEVAQTIFEAIIDDNKGIRYSVGKDADFILKNKKKMSDKDFDMWIQESIIEQKGFVR